MIYIEHIGRLAQLVELRPYKPEVTGSTPVAPTSDGAVVQLVRMLACHAGDRGFEPRPLRQEEGYESIPFFLYDVFILGGFMNLVQAGYEILTILAIADGIFDDSEKQVIIDFIENNYEGDFNIENEDAFLRKLTVEKKLETQFITAAQFFKANVCSENRYKMLDFAFDLVVADGDIADEEATLFNLLGDYWEIDMDLYFTQKREKIVEDAKKDYLHLDPNCKK